MRTEKQEASHHPRSGEPVIDCGTVSALTTSYCDPSDGGGSVWLSSAPTIPSYLILTYWGIGNPGRTGKRQRPETISTPRRSSNSTPIRDDCGGDDPVTPNDGDDYDAVEIPVLVDNWGGARIKVVTWANRNGNFYVPIRDRTLPARQAVRQGRTGRARSMRRPGRLRPQPPGQPTYPGNQVGTNWVAVVQPVQGIVYVSAWEDYASMTCRCRKRDASARTRRRRPRNFNAVPVRPVSGEV